MLCNGSGNAVEKTVLDQEGISVKFQVIFDEKNLVVYDTEAKAPYKESKYSFKNVACFEKVWKFLAGKFMLFF